MTVVSWHHQASGTISAEWRIAAKAPDGVIEALEHKHYPWAIALQWHPEMSIQDSAQYRLFHTFVTAAKQRQGTWKTA